MCFGEDIKNFYRKANTLLKDFHGVMPYMTSFLAHNFFIVFACIFFCIKNVQPSSCEELIQIDGLICIFHKNKQALAIKMTANNNSYPPLNLFGWKSEFIWITFISLLPKLYAVTMNTYFTVHCTKKWSFSLKISSANVIKSAVSCGFAHIYWRNP